MSRQHAPSVSNGRDSAKNSISITLRKERKLPGASSVTIGHNSAPRIMDSRPPANPKLALIDGLLHRAFMIRR
jgi:hypothetical protein